jgi:hypothetical protein
MAALVCRDNQTDVEADPWAAGSSFPHSRRTLDRESNVARFPYSTL